MRNLLLFIWKNNFFFLFILLESISLALVVNNNLYQRANFINSSNYTAAAILQSYSNVTDYFSLKDKNKSLAEENAKLRSMNHSAFINTKAKVQVIADSNLMKKYEYVTAKVVGNTTNRRNNYITIDIGANQGVTADMGVISGSGVVGIIKNTSSNFSSVMSLLNSKTIVSCKLKRDGSFGPLSWNGKDYTIATLKDIPTHVRITKGDTVVTSGYSSTYPENILVGTVDSFYREKGEYFYSVNVKLSTDFKKLGYVYIIKNILKIEQDSLEQAQKDDK